MSASRPLEGLLVVAVEQAVAAPYCSCRLADAGARVIKVERPEGDFARGYDRVCNGASAYFVWLNRGKESIALDLKAAADRAVLDRMIAGADVFLQNLGPGVAKRLGLGSDTLRSRHPSLVTCDISGYGESGPYADMKAYDLLVQAESGLAAITGRPEGPGRVGVSVCDIGAGMYAYMAVLEALMARARTGEGRAIHVSLFDAIADWMNVPYLHHVYGGAAPARVGLNHPSIAPYGVYAMQDGDVLFSIQNEREWQRLCEVVLERPALATDPLFSDNVARVANRAALDREITAVFSALPRATLQARLQKAGIAFGFVNEVAGLASHPQLRTTEVATEQGPVRVIASPARQGGGVDETNGAASAVVPALDADGARLRAEFAPQK